MVTHSTVTHTTVTHSTVSIAIQSDVSRPIGHRRSSLTAANDRRQTPPRSLCYLIWICHNVQTRARQKGCRVDEQCVWHWTWYVPCYALSLSAIRSLVHTPYILSWPQNVTNRRITTCQRVLTGHGEVSSVQYTIIAVARRRDLWHVTCCLANDSLSYRINKQASLYSRRLIFQRSAQGHTCRQFFNSLRLRISVQLESQSRHTSAVLTKVLWHVLLLCFFFVALFLFSCEIVSDTTSELF